jgi:hypothetical protein
MNDGVTCQVLDHTFAEPLDACPAPQLPTAVFALQPGGPAQLQGCSGQGSFAGTPTLSYGQTRSVGMITCDSEESGVTCTDSSSGHFFRAASDSYQLG